jgi:hypothetical protein
MRNGEFDELYTGTDFGLAAVEMDCSVTYLRVKKIGEIEVELHSFLSSALNGG